MNFGRYVAGYFTVVAFAFLTNANAVELDKLRECAERQAHSVGYHVAGVDRYDGSYFDVRLAQGPGSTESVRDVVEADEARGGGMYDRLVSMRNAIKSCSGFYGRLDISDFDGAAIAKDR
ncbi:hypothetical protein TspCOW1_05310 [Thiohalobacter sp. COW1]|nr:hypothetical protein TspCOW1_05310 [Thiohalobacter sp. COW1]